MKLEEGVERANPLRDRGRELVPVGPISDRPGYFMMLLSPRAELSKTQQVPRDFIYVIDTSGSMRGKRLTQAKNALKYCLKNLSEGDRFTRHGTHRVWERPPSLMLRIT